MKRVFTQSTRLTKSMIFVVLCLLMAANWTPSSAKEFHGISEALWSPDGSRIAFIYSDSTERNFVQELYVMTVTGTTPTKLADNVESFAWSPDSKQIAFSHQNVSGISVMGVSKLDGSGAKELSRSGKWPAWSADGKQILYVGVQYDLYIMNIDGSNPQPFTELKSRPAAIWETQWSADGQSAAFTGQTSEVNVFGLYVANKSGIRELEKSDFIGNASWSPDGKQLVAETTCGKHPPTLCIYDTATGEARVLGYGHSPLWSPDGKQIAYWYNSQVCVIKPDGADQQCLTEKQENNIVTLHSWSPDGKRLLFSRAFSPDPNGNAFTFEFDTFILDVQRATVKRWFEGGMIKR